MHPTTIAAIRGILAEAGFAGAYDALAESHAELIKALEGCLAALSHMEEHGGSTPAETLIQAQAALTEARKLGAKGA